MNEESFNNDSKIFKKSLLIAFKLLKICPKQEINLNLAHNLIFSNFQLIEEDACLFTSCLGLLCHVSSNNNNVETMKYRIPYKLQTLFERAQKFPLNLLN